MATMALARVLCVSNKHVTVSRVLHLSLICSYLRAAVSVVVHIVVLLRYLLLHHHLCTFTCTNVHCDRYLSVLAMSSVVAWNWHSLMYLIQCSLMTWFFWYT